MALIPICAGLCSSAEGLCESCQHCKTASLEGEREDVQTSIRGLCASAVSKALGMFLLSLNSPCAPTSGSRTARGLQAQGPLPCRAACQLPRVGTFALKSWETKLSSLLTAQCSTPSWYNSQSFVARDGNSVLELKSRVGEARSRVQNISCCFWVGMDRGHGYSRCWQCCAV